MTDQQHPITPPPELLADWLQQACKYSPCDNSPGMIGGFMAYQAARWGADKELEDCCEWIDRKIGHGSEWGAVIRAARRPKPPTLNSIALQMLGTIERDAHYLPEITDTIRKALQHRALEAQ